MSLQYAILGLLEYEPMSGYELKSALDRFLGHIWAAHLSQIYRELVGLEKKSYALSKVEVQKDRPDKRVYSITAQGKEEFHRWLGSFPKELASPLRDEFSLRVFFGAKIDSSEMIFQLKRFVREQQEENTALKAIEAAASDYAAEANRTEDMKYWRFTIKRKRMMNDTLVRWAEGCIEELEDRRSERTEFTRGMIYRRNDDQFLD